MIEVRVASRPWRKDVPDCVRVARQAAETCLQAVRGNTNAEIVVLLTDNQTIKNLNARFRGKNSATNVLAFPPGFETEGYLGDIALAYAVCADEAYTQQKPLAHHLQHLVVHGVLHLLGYDHAADDEAEAMERLERDILAGLGVADPYA